MDRGADLDIGANTPLMEAAQEGHLDTVKYLIQASLAQRLSVSPQCFSSVDGRKGHFFIQIDASTATGDTALTYAAENGHTEVCATLLDAGGQIVSVILALETMGRLCHCFLACHSRGIWFL